MDKKTRIIIAAVAVAFGLLLGLTQAEDSKYSYKA